MKIDPSKKYQTRDGKPVTHLHRVPDGWPSTYPWRGLANGSVITWCDNGRAFSDNIKSRCDLLEVREPIEVLLVVDARDIPVVFGGNAAGWDHASPEHAPHRIATFREVLP